MKFATYIDGSRDGELVLVSRDLQSAVFTAGIASRLQQVLDDWNFFAPQLQMLYDALSQGRAAHTFAFDPSRCLAPLPRVCDALELWGEGGTAGARALRAGLIQGPLEPVWTGAPQEVAGPRAPGRPRRNVEPVDALQGEVAPMAADGRRGQVGLLAVLGDVSRGTAAEPALAAVRLLVAAQRWSAPGDDDTCLAVSCAPVAVTPDEWGTGWQGGQLRGRLSWAPAGRKLPAPKQAPAVRGPAAGALAAGLAQACRFRPLAPGAVLWAPLETAVPEFERLDRDSCLQWSLLPDDGPHGFGVCAPSIDPTHQAEPDPQGAIPHPAPVVDPDAQSDA